MNSHHVAIMQQEYIMLHPSFTLCFVFFSTRKEGKEKGILTTSFDAHVRTILIKAPNGRKWCTPSTQGIQRAAKGNKNSIDDQQNTT